MTDEITDYATLQGQRRLTEKQMGQTREELEAQGYVVDTPEMQEARRQESAQEAQRWAALAPIEKIREVLRQGQRIDSAYACWKEGLAALEEVEKALAERKSMSEGLGRLAKENERLKAELAKQACVMCVPNRLALAERVRGACTGVRCSFKRHCGCISLIRSLDLAKLLEGEK